jgi:WD40 repeat protein
MVLLAEEGSPQVLVLVSTRQAIYKYSFVKNCFFKAAHLPLGALSPRLAPFTPLRLLLSSRDNLLQTVTVGKQSQQIHLQAIEEQALEHELPLKVHFYLGTLSETQDVLVGVVGRRSKGLVASRWDGSIDIWSTHEELLSRNGLTLSAHTAPAGDLSLSEDQRCLLSGGSKDGMIVEWQLQLCRERLSAVLPCGSREEQDSKTLDTVALRTI